MKRPIGQKSTTMNSRFGSTPKSFPVADIRMVLFDPARTTPSKSVAKKKRPEVDPRNLQGKDVDKLPFDNTNAAMLSIFRLGNRLTELRRLTQCIAPITTTTGSLGRLIQVGSINSWMPKR